MSEIYYFYLYKWFYNHIIEPELFLNSRRCNEIWYFLFHNYIKSILIFKGNISF